MHQYAADTEDFSGVQQTQAGITHQRPSDTAALIRKVDSESTKHSNWDWIWHVSLEATWCFWCPDRSGGESVVSNDAVPLTDNEST